MSEVKRPDHTICSDWKPREGQLRDLVALTRTADLNGNWLAFLATPDGYEAEIVSEPVAFNESPLSGNGCKLQ